MSIDGYSDNRFDPENALGMYFHAPRALARNDLINLRGDELRKAIMETRFRNVGAHTGEAELFRSKLLAFLDQLDQNASVSRNSHVDGNGFHTESVQLLRHEVLRESLVRSVPETVRVWTNDLDFSDAPHESVLIQMAEEWLQSLPQTVLDGFLRLCPDSTRLVVVPKYSSSAALAEDFNGKATPLGRPLEIAIFHKNPWEYLGHSAWSFALTDLNLALTDGLVRHFPTSVLQQQVDSYQQIFDRAELRMMPPEAYLPATLTSLYTQNSVLDMDTNTFFALQTGQEKLCMGNARNSKQHWGAINLVGAVPPGMPRSDLLRCRPWYESGPLLKR